MAAPTTPAAAYTPAASPIPLDTWSSPSPNGAWIVSGLMEGPYAVGEVEHYRVRLSVASADGLTEWVIVDETRRYGLGYSIPSPFHWSSDGRFLYYTEFYVPDGCALFVNGGDLQRLDLADGTVAEIIPDGAWWVSLSPDERRAAYVYWDGSQLELRIRDTATTRERSIGFDPLYTQAGAIVWSPDARALALTLASHPCEPPNWTQAVARVELETLQATVLLSDDSPLLTTADWPETALLELTDETGQIWLMDLRTGNLAKASN